MKRLSILVATLLAGMAVSAQAAPSGPRCPAGVTPGNAECHAKGQRGADMLERLKAADTNADGAISKDEAQLALPRLYEHFDAIDADGNGLITLKEMQAARSQRHGARMAEMFKKLDANGDGKLSAEEVTNAPRLAAHFAAIDTDDDGFLSQAELQAARSRHGPRGRS